MFIFVNSTMSHPWIEHKKYPLGRGGRSGENELLVIATTVAACGNVAAIRIARKAPKVPDEFIDRFVTINVCASNHLFLTICVRFR